MIYPNFKYKNMSECLIFYQIYDLMKHNIDNYIIICSIEDVLPISLFLFIFIFNSFWPPYLSNELYFLIKHSLLPLTTGLGWVVILL